MHHEWGLLIVVYLFLGGLSAGALAISAVATLAGERLARTARVGALAAPWPVLLGTALLVLDLGRPLFFWKLLLALAPRSPMWIGTWLLSVFAVVSLAYANLFLPPARQPWRPADPARWRTRLAIVGLPIAIGVALYTGVLLGVMVARPLWNTPLLAQLFLVSALSTASALIVALLRDPGAVDERRLLVTADAWLIAVEIVVLAAMFVGGLTGSASAAGALTLLATRGSGAAFWGGVVVLGLLVPLAIEAMELRHRPAGRPSPAFALAVVLAPALVLVGGFLLRWVLVYSGQISRLT